MEKPKLTRPTVHLNGTSRKELAEGYYAAVIALTAALDVLGHSPPAPHGRDYYPQGDDAIHRATEEHRDRIKRVTSVLEEMREIGEELVLGGDE